MIDLIATGLWLQGQSIRRDADRIDDIEAHELRREDRELLERQRWGMPSQRNNPDNPNWE